MGRSQHYQSPSKKLRNLVRLVKYLKFKLNSPTSFVAKTQLSRSSTVTTSLVPKLAVLSLKQQPGIDIPPCKPIYIPTASSISTASLITDLRRPQTDVYTNRSNVKQNTRPVPSPDGHIPQLDGVTERMFHLHPQPAPDLIQCKTCQRKFETMDDFRWHKETQIGQDDCRILRSMLHDYGKL